jgi:hypothetical protein
MNGAPRTIVGSIEGEYRRCKMLAEGAMVQLTDDELGRPGPGGSSSVATIGWHIAGNLASRFTEFLTTDGEKPWRDRESEFVPEAIAREALLADWNRGWKTLFEALDGLGDEDLGREVRIRGTAHAVHDALHRSLAHTAYHVGQIVLLARSLRGPDWKWLSIPPGESEAYNRNPTRERPNRHASALGSATESARGDNA